MKIVHLTPYYAPAWGYGGVVRAVSSLATAQADQGHGVTVLTTDTLTPTERVSDLRETRDGVTVIRCRNQIGGLRRLNLSTPMGLRRILRTLNADVIHCHELRTVENLLALSATRAPLILSPHGTLPRDTGRTTVKRLWDRLFGRALARRFNGIIALTEAEAADTRALWQALDVVMPPFVVIPNGVAEAPLRTDRINGASGLNVLFMARLHERKGLQFLIPAFAEAAVPNAHLIVAGPDEGMLAHARQLAETCGVADRVRFVGMLSGAEKEKALAEADLFVLPAIGEGLPLTALEAMAAGVPIIVTPGCNLPETETRGAGLIVPRAVTPLADAIRALLHDSDRCARMGLAGRGWMREAYAWPSLAARTTAFYERIVNPTNG